MRAVVFFGVVRGGVHRFLRLLRGCFCRVASDLARIIGPFFVPVTAAFAGPLFPPLVAGVFFGFGEAAASVFEEYVVQRGA